MRDKAASVRNVLHAVEDAERLKRRRKLLVWSALPVLLVLLTAVKLLSIGVLGGRAAEGFERRDSAAVASAASGLAAANVFEPHKALFAAGDASVLEEDYAGARARFEEALAVAPAADDCRVRVNLALSIELLGDTARDAGDRDQGLRLYREALAVIGEAPPECFRETPWQAEEGRRLNEASDQLQDKTDSLAQEQPAPGQPARDDAENKQPDPSEDALRSRLEQLEQTGRTAQQERNDGRQRDEYLDGDGKGTDKPW